MARGLLLGLLISQSVFQGTLFGSNTLFILLLIKNFNLGIYSHVWFSFILQLIYILMTHGTSFCP